MLRRLARLGLLVVLGFYLTGCCIAPHGGWMHGDRGGYGDRR